MRWHKGGCVLTTWTYAAVFNNCPCCKVLQRGRSEVDKSWMVSLTLSNQQHGELPTDVDGLSPIYFTAMSKSQRTASFSQTTCVHCQLAALSNKTGLLIQLQSKYDLPGKNVSVCISYGKKWLYCPWSVSTYLLVRSRY